MTAEAKAVYEAILEHGPLDTVRLQREARLSARSAKSRFDRALTDLQVGLKVLPVGIARAGAGATPSSTNFSPRWLPNVPKRARPISRREARRHILLRYLRTVVAATTAQAARLFGWAGAEMERTVAQLEKAGFICAGVAIEGMAGAYLVRLA